MGCMGNERVPNLGAIQDSCSAAFTCTNKHGVRFAHFSSRTPELRLLPSPHPRHQETPGRCCAAQTQNKLQASLATSAEQGSPGPCQDRARARTP